MIKHAFIFVLCSFMLFGCAQTSSIHIDRASLQEKPIAMPEKSFTNHQAFVEERSPTEWGEQVTGVMTRLDTNDPVVALTFDLCGGPHGKELDEELLDYLIRENIHATLFVNYRWIQDNKEQFLALNDNPLFQIENHGTEHRPLSVSGQAAWGIEGTNNADEVVAEVMTNQEEIERLTSETPTMFRSGTAYYDDVSVEIVESLGLQVVNFDIAGDAGATFSADQIEHALLQSQPGSIVLLHLNQPDSDVAEGVMRSLPQLEGRGLTFVHLDDYTLTS
ncbi:polysaccharide deacetylase family protein [Geomicrobium sp. JSM 1781026]|uniref:polysaccharide deacetylase family protein n=1 Tax=Geomicrobium sp. JSM 1781026 TaxID=3344580 RepID=UPI0035C13519